MPQHAASTTKSRSSAAKTTEALAAQPAYAFWLVIVSLFVVLAIFIVAVIEWDDAGDVATGVGTVSGIIAALVGAFFGIRGATYASIALGQAKAGGGGTTDEEDEAPTDGGPQSEAKGKRREVGQPDAGPAPQRVPGV